MTESLKSLEEYMRVQPIPGSHILRGSHPAALHSAFLWIVHDDYALIPSSQISRRKA